MVPGWFRDGSALVPCNGIRQHTINCQSHGWFRDGSRMAPPQFLRKSWLRVEERRTLPKKPWEETVEAFRTRLTKACCNVNTNCDVEGLCRQLPERIQTLHMKKEVRLRK